ncbi:MAG: hypothetical protein FWH28_04205, partial [Clostridiales bacterium]|nr:hypothetical protein [Clostridiales bacterium]
VMLFAAFQSILSDFQLLSGHFPNACVMLFTPSYMFCFPIKPESRVRIAPPFPRIPSISTALTTESLK